MQVHHAVPGRPHYPARSSQQAEINLAAGRPEETFNIDSTEYRGKPAHELFINAYRFEVSTGLRPGEVIGLKCSDIANSTVFLKRSINVYGEETTGKNENAQRIFTLTEISRAILNAQREHQEQNGIETEWVFSDEYGECAKENRYYKRWVHYCEVMAFRKPQPTKCAIHSYRS